MVKCTGWKIGGSPWKRENPVPPSMLFCHFSFPEQASKTNLTCKTNFGKRWAARLRDAICGLHTNHHSHPSFTANHWIQPLPTELAEERLLTNKSTPKKCLIYVNEHFVGHRWLITPVLRTQTILIGKGIAITPALPRPIFTPERLTGYKVRL